MTDKKKTGGKSVLVKDLMAKGFTARKAQKAVNAVFDCMKLGLWWGEPVEVPGGTIQAKIRQGRPRRKLQRFQNVQTGKTAFRLVTFQGRRRVVKFKADEGLDLTPPPAPETPEQVKARQLATELLGKPADQAIMATLQQGVEVHPQRPWERLERKPDPGTLLRRLRCIKAKGLRFYFDSQLAHEVAMHYWL
jgi:nucleoid DNA-binding protein